MTTEVHYLLWRMIYGRLRFNWSIKRSGARKTYLRRHDWPAMCANCKVTLAREEATIDHIIPQWLCYEFGMLWLVIDWGNFRLVCAPCNRNKGGTMPEWALPMLAHHVQRLCPKEAK